MPITEAVVAIVHHGLPLSELGTRLLGRPRKPEGV
jgi:glycerol-3-phosphate dehydrogenase (NAD(P)+)